MKEEERRADERGREKSRWKRKREEQMEEEEKRVDGRRREKSG